MTTTTQPDDEIGFDQPELFPEIMIYFTVRLGKGGTWSDHVRISTPDGRETLISHGRSGGILLAGRRKMSKDFDDALATATEYLQPFND